MTQPARAAVIGFLFLALLAADSPAAEAACSLTADQKERFARQFNGIGADGPGLGSLEFQRGLRMAAIKGGMQDIVARVCGLEAEAEAERRLLFAIADDWRRIAGCVGAEGDFAAMVRDGFDLGRRKMHRQDFTCSAETRRAVADRLAQQRAASEAQRRQTAALMRLLEIPE